MEQPFINEKLYMSKLTPEQLKEVKSQFHEYDTDNSGAISLHELEKILSAYLDKDTIKKMMKSFDKNHDKKVTLKEFIKAHE